MCVITIYNKYTFLLILQFKRFYSASSEGTSKKSHFWWDNIVMGPPSNRKPLLTELWDKPFTKRPISPSISKI